MKKLALLLFVLLAGCGETVYQGPLMDGKMSNYTSIAPHSFSKMSQEHELLMHEIQTLRTALLDERLTKRCPK